MFYSILIKKVGIIFGEADDVILRVSEFERYLCL